jgi:hypothetical protein
MPLLTTDSSRNSVIMPPIHQSTPNTSQRFHFPQQQQQQLDNDHSYLDLAHPSPACGSSSSSASSSGYSSPDDPPSTNTTDDDSRPLSSLIDDYVNAVLSNATTPPTSEFEDSPSVSPQPEEVLPAAPMQETAAPVWPPYRSAFPDANNKYPVPMDLRAAIVAANPGRHIEFVSSQRLNLQMRLDGYLLNKKKGPRETRQGRTINWRCVNPACRFTLTSYEGQFVRGKLANTHNHEPQPALYKRRTTTAAADRWPL